MRFSEEQRDKADPEFNQTVRKRVGKPGSGIPFDVEPR